VLAIDGWVRALAAVLLLAGVAELLLPSGSMKGYARAFLGLLVLLAVLQPIVGLVRGQLRLDLPPAGASGPAASSEAGAAESAAASAYEGLVAAQAARIAEQVPGVDTATATVRFSGTASAAPAVAGASVVVLPNAAGLTEPDLSGQVQQAVASGLAVGTSAVSVALG